MSDAKTFDERAREAAHAAFDPLWLTAKNRRLARKEAYARLAVALGIQEDYCHIAMFDVKQCRRVVELSKESP